MKFLSHTLTRTPSLRARVVVATAIGAAIPVLITCAVVWFGITNDRKERLDRRLDEAAGFAIPFLPRQGSLLMRFLQCHPDMCRDKRRPNAALSGHRLQACPH